VWENLNISILLTGSELVEGRLKDSNSFFLAEFLDQNGLKLNRIMFCDDDPDQIVESLKFLSGVSDVIITSGGLGPTPGDKTRESIATFLGTELEIHQDSLDRIKNFFAKRNRPYSINNDKQALIPRSSQILSNDIGTATCFCSLFSKSQSKAGLICALPGVPAEFELLILEKVMPAISEHFALQALDKQALARVELRIFGLSEAGIAKSIVETNVSGDMHISYRATFPEVRVLIRAANKEINFDSVSLCAADLKQQIGSDSVFSQNGKNLPETIHALLLDGGLSLSLAESCSGGLLSSLITSNPGCSKYFLGSTVAYDNRIKEEILGVAPKGLKDFGAVSAEVARDLALNCQNKFSADIAISITGVAGPDGGSEDKPVGTVYLACAFKDQLEVFKIFYPGSRERVQQYVSYLALDQLRRKLLGIAGIESLSSVSKSI
jgi:nicotinamide-nucleotide amidase